MKNEKLKIKNLFLFLFLAGALLLPLLSLAQGLVPCGNPGQPPCTFCHFFVLFDNVIDFLLKYVVFPLAVLMIVIGGFMYVFGYLGPGGGGQPALISQANKVFTTTIFGLLIIFGAWLIINLFFQVIGVNEWTNLREGWWQIDCSVPTPVGP